MSKPIFFIGDRIIGDEFPPFIISEIGINHGGSLETALNMVEAAYQSGAEAIKFQTHIPDEEMSKSAKEIIPVNADKSIYDIMKSCLLTIEEERIIKEYVESKGMIFLSTPFSKAAVDRLENLGVLAYKIGSGECNNIPLIKYIASLGKPIILSTGMNTIKQIANSIETIQKYNTPFAILHCTNLYPTSPEQVRLGGINQLKAEFPNTIVGLSDHTCNNYSSIAAVALGASIIERHFTDNKDRKGPDIICSMTPADLRSLIQATQDVHKMVGGNAEPCKEEKITARFAFATVVAMKPIMKGEVFTTENIWVKRPAAGDIHAENYDGIIGRVATRDIPFDEHLKWDDIGETLPNG